MKLDVVAVYGAATGTLALLLQFRQWRADRGQLKVQGQISILHTNCTAVVLKIHAVNVGRRPVKIRRVAVFLTTSSAPLPPGLSRERVAEISSGLVSSELCAFDGNGGPVELSPYGGDHTWAMPIKEGFDFLSKTEDGEQYGEGYVMLTSGRKIGFKFLLLKHDQWPPFASATQVGMARTTS